MSSLVDIEDRKYSNSLDRSEPVPVDIEPAAVDTDRVPSFYQGTHDWYSELGYEMPVDGSEVSNKTRDTKWCCSTLTFLTTNKKPLLDLDQDLVIKDGSGKQDRDSSEVSVDGIDISIL